MLQRLMFGLVLMVMCFVGTAQANSQSQAQVLWKTLNGTNLNPNSDTGKTIIQHIENNDMKRAAMVAARSPLSSFATTVVRNLVTPMAAREVNPSEPAGDFVLTWMVAALNDIPVQQLFLTDVRYSTTNSTNYEQNTTRINQFLETSVSDQQITQALNNRSIRDYRQGYIRQNDQTVGVLTSTQYGKAVFDMGTNRRPVTKVVEDWLCIDDIRQIMNFNIEDNWVGRDIPRGPEPEVYLNECMGCHAGMDAARGAWAGFDFVNNVVTWTANVTGKMNINEDVFPNGYFTTDHSWQHNGWLPIGDDFVGQTFMGPRPFIKLFLGSPKFYQCLTKRGIDTLCPKKTYTKKVLNKIAKRFHKQQKLTDMLTDVTVEVCLKD